MDKPWDLVERTMQFAVAVFHFCRPLTRNPDAQDAARQLRRAGAGVASNYRSARRGRSERDFASKIGVAIEESDESAFWLEFLVRTGLAKRETVRELQGEAGELVAILTASQKTVRAKAKQDKQKNGARVKARARAVQSS